MMFQIPKSLKSEHESLHTTLLRAGKEKGELGQCAQVLSKLLHPHMLREETLAFPLLGLLRQLAAGTVNAEMAEAIAAGERLRSEAASMAEEHRLIGEALKQLLALAGAEDRTEYADFAYQLIEHIRVEEEVLYPAALLVGDYVRLKLGR